MQEWLRLFYILAWGAYTPFYYRSTGVSIDRCEDFFCLRRGPRSYPPLLRLMVSLYIPHNLVGKVRWLFPGDKFLFLRTLRMLCEIYARFFKTHVFFTWFLNESCLCCRYLDCWQNNLPNLRLPYPAHSFLLFLQNFSYSWNRFFHLLRVKISLWRSGDIQKTQRARHRMQLHWLLISVLIRRFGNIFFVVFFSWGYCQFYWYFLR